MDYSDAEAVEAAAQIIEIQQQEASLIYMSLATIHTKQSAGAKKKVINLFKDSIKILRGEKTVKPLASPFDMAREGKDLG